MRSLRRTPVLVSVLLLTAAACGGGDDSPSAAPETPTTVATTVPPVTTTIAPPPTVTLDSPGAQPRQPLVLKLAAGSTARAAMVNKLTLKMTVGGQTAPAGVVPATRIVITQKVDKVDPAGTASVSISYSDASVVPTPGADPAVVEATRAGIEPMNRVRSTNTVDPQGAVTNVAFDSAALTDPTLKGIADSMASQVGSLAAPFPKEPVGVGARWTVTSTATLSGIKTTTTTRFTLRSRTGDRYELDMTQDAVGATGPVQLPNLPAGAQASVTSFTIKSTGLISGDLTRHLPTKSTVKGTGGGSFVMTIGNEKVTLVQDMTIDVATSPA